MHVNNNSPRDNSVETVGGRCPAGGCSNALDRYFEQELGGGLVERCFHEMVVNKWRKLCHQVIAISNLQSEVVLQQTINIKS